MANPWFKMYGVEMLADPKYQRLNALERSCWITLLCLASMDNGIVKHCEEAYLITHSGIDPSSSDFSKVHGITVKLEMLGMITKHRDEIGIEYIQIKNWEKRQEVYSESRERVAKWREKQKGIEDVTTVTLHGNGKKRIEENRNTAKADSSTIRIERVTKDDEVVEPRTPKDPMIPKYESLLKWAEARRGFTFKNRIKQYSALKKARLSDISLTKLKDRWAECEGDTWRDGFDWTSVVSSFDKKA